MDIEKLKYPVGKVVRPESYTNEYRAKAMKVISDFPLELEKAVVNLTVKQLLGRYRPDGWSIQQVVHHCADSHMNAFTRFKLTLTEDHPTIKPYEEKLWAVSADADNPDLTDSLNIIKGVHSRWLKLMQSMKDEQWDLSFYHPETQRDTSLNLALTIYEWHCRHHLQHILNAIENPY